MYTVFPAAECTLHLIYRVTSKNNIDILKKPNVNNKTDIPCPQKTIFLIHKIVGVDHDDSTAH